MASITPSYNREGEHIGWQVAIRKKGFPAQYKTFRTRKEADAWATVAESEMLRGVWRDRSESESTTLMEALDRYAEEIVPSKKPLDKNWFDYANGRPNLLPRCFWRLSEVRMLLRS